MRHKVTDGKGKVREHDDKEFSHCQCHFISKKTTKEAEKSVTESSRSQEVTKQFRLSERLSWGVRVCCLNTNQRTKSCPTIRT